MYPLLEGGKTGPNPTDKGKSGSKRHVVVDRGGIPLAVIHSAANVHDLKVLEEAVDTIPPIRKPSCGRQRKRPKKLHTDKAYDFPRCRQALRKRSITPRIARRGIESSEKLGRYRWEVERTSVAVESLPAAEGVESALSFQQPAFGVLKGHSLPSL